MKLLLLLLAALSFVRPADAQVIEPIVTDRQQIRYDFDGIEGTLSLIAYIGEGSDKSVGLILKCSESETRLSVSFDGIPPLTPVTHDRAPGMLTIGTVVIGALQFDYTSSTTGYSARPNERILDVTKELYQGLLGGIVIRANEVDTGLNSGTRYVVRLAGPFKERAIMPDDRSETVDHDVVKREFGSFYQLCSIWW